MSPELTEIKDGIRSILKQMHKCTTVNGTEFIDTLSGDSFVTALENLLKPEEEKTYRNNMEKAIAMIKRIVPEDFATREGLFKRLDWIMNDYCYRAPEIRGISWSYVEPCLGAHFGEQDGWNDWQHEIVDNILEIVKTGN